ncbi:unnamed protein product, partial [Iphiclides podalirius]
MFFNGPSQIDTVVEVFDVGGGKKGDMRGAEHLRRMHSGARCSRRASQSGAQTPPHHFKPVRPHFCPLPRSAFVFNCD